MALDPLATGEREDQGLLQSARMPEVDVLQDGLPTRGILGVDELVGQKHAAAYRQDGGHHVGDQLLVAGEVFVSALTGFGMDTLRAEIASVLASLWVDVDVAVPYTAGELLARVRERGTVDLEYRERDVHVSGRVAPALAGELESIAAAPVPG